MKKFTHPPLKASLVLSALAALAFGTVAVGGTYALFTSSAETNITVTTGKVSLKSELKKLVAKSPESISLDGTINKTSNTDEDGYLIGENGTFINGGSAKIEGNKVILSNITPGDLVEFDLEITNDSTIDIKYRSLFNQVTPDGTDNVASKELAASMNIKAGEKDMTGIVEYRSAWETVKVGEGNKTIHFVIELPTTVSASQGASTNFSFAVEAVQGNAATEGDEFVSKYTTASSANDIQAALSDLSSEEGATIALSEDVTLGSSALSVSGEGKEVSLDLNGKSIENNYSAENTLTVNYGANVSISNGEIKGTSSKELDEKDKSTSLVNVKGGSTLNLENVTIDTSSGIYTNALSVFDSDAEVNVVGGELKASYYFALATNGSSTKNATITLNGTKVETKSTAMFLAGDANVELIDCEVTGYTVICGGATKIQGGTYSTNMKSVGFENNSNYKGATKDQPSKSGLYFSQDSNGKYYIEPEAVYAGLTETWTSGSIAFWDPITIIENRQGGYQFNSVEIKDATVEIANKATTDIVFGIRYANGSDATKYDSENVTITNCKTDTADYLYSADFFKTLA